MEGIVIHTKLHMLDKEIHYHMLIRDCKNKNIINQWISARRCTQSSMPKGCMMERYFLLMEKGCPDIKKVQTLDEAFSALRYRKFLFKKKPVTHGFQGFPPIVKLAPAKEMKLSVFDMVYIWLLKANIIILKGIK